LEEGLGMIDFYQLLGVPETAEKKEIKLAYYAMAKECHPVSASADRISFSYLPASETLRP
jgi:DnaJ-class molecular chaperone